MNSSGNLTTLHSFSGGNDGSQPLDGLIQGSDGLMHGTTFFGGVSNSGTVFRLDLSGNLTILYSFSGGTDGYGPEGSLIQANDGNFYGTTQNGGDLSCDIAFGAGCGTVFRIDSSGNLSTLHSFSGTTDGANPDEAVMQAIDGSFYGTTLFGGDPSCTICTCTGCGLAIAPAIAGAAGAVCLLLMKSRMDDQVLAKGQSTLQVNYEIGYSLALILLVAGAVWNALLFSQRKRGPDSCNCATFRPTTRGQGNGSRLASSYG